MGRIVHLAVIALLASACGTAPVPTPTPVLTLVPTDTSAPTLRLYSFPADGYQVALPEAWLVQDHPSEEVVLEAHSPVAGTTLKIYYTPDALDHDELTLPTYFAESQDFLEAVYNATMSHETTTLGGSPAIRGEIQEAAPTTNHVVYYTEWPARSLDIWSIIIDTDGTSADPAIDAIVESFAFTD